MRNYTFQITPSQATEMAQAIHNDIDENGEINEGNIVELLSEELAEKLEAWLKENIDWGQIASDDLATREDYKEFFNSQLRGWAN